MYFNTFNIFEVFLIKCLHMTMMLDKVAADYGIEVTDEQVDSVISDYMASYGYDGTYTIEEFKEAFKAKYPEIYDIYEGDKEDRLDKWLENVTKNLPKK